MRRFSLFLAISVLLHIIFFFSVYLSPNVKPEKDVIEVSYVTPPEKIEKADKSLEKNRQIVDQDDKAINQETPDKDYFLSKNNQTVLKQTIAKDKGEFKNAKANAKVKHTNAEKATAAQPVSIPTPRPEKFNPLSDTANTFREKSFNTMASATPSSSAAVSQTQDYLKDKAYGVETILSTKEFKYYTYFNRIRRQLSQHWEPKVRDKLTKMFRQGRTIASDQDRTTKLLIILDQKGVLVKVQLVSDSGVKDLDEAAIESFRSAAPFPNPPKGIVDPDGTVKIRWDFVLES